LVDIGVLSRVDTSPDLLAQFVASITPSPETGKSEICPPQQMFIFSPGDVTLFREGNNIVSYLTTKHFTPAFMPSVYIANGVLIPGGFVTTNAIPFFSTEGLRPAEDFVISEDGKNIYRTTRYFNAEQLVFNWDGFEVPNTARIEELSGNLLRVVNKYVCEENVAAPNGPATSGTKLGIAQLSFRSKSSDLVVTEFIWENTNFFSQVPQLSYATASKEIFAPINYGDGTLAL
jgi:hypothetical protein